MVLTLGLYFLLLLKRWHNTALIDFIRKCPEEEKSWVGEEARRGYEWADDGIKLPLSQ